MPPLLEELVVEFLDRLERTGAAESAVLEELAALHPEQAGPLRERVAALRDMGLLYLSSGEQVREVPKRLGDFDFEELLGEGGMGVVYRATQRSMRRQVAIKLMRPGFLDRPAARVRFAREAEAVARLSHPGIIAVHVSGEEQGIPYLVMELVSGLSLDRVLRAVAGRNPRELSGADFQRALLKGGGLEAGAASAEGESPLFCGSWHEACLRVARDIARALAHAHERGVLHRDVKPSNIMLTREGRVLLLDFGLASLVGEQAMTRSGAMVGSLPYMAPEQVEGNRAALDARTDVYGLGVTLYQMLTLKSPHLDPESSERTRARILDGRPVAPRSLSERLPKDAQSVVLVAMDREAALEPGSSPEVALDRARAQVRLGDLCEDLGDLDGARTALESAIAAFQLAGIGPGSARAPDFAGAYRNLASVCERRKQREPALEFIDKGLALVPAGQTDPKGNASRTQLKALRGKILRRSGKREEARSELLGLIDELNVGDNFENTERAELAAWCHNELSELESARGDPAGRRAQLERALAFREGLFARDPGSRGTRQRLLVSLSNLGSAQLQLGEFSSALPLLLRAAELGEKLVVEFPGLPDYRYNLSGVLINLGTVHYNLDDIEPAVVYLERASEILARLLEAEPQRAEYRAHLIAATSNLVAFKLQQQHYAQALERLVAFDTTLTELLEQSPGELNLVRTAQFNALNRIRAHWGLKQAAEAKRTTLESIELGGRRVDFRVTRSKAAKKLRVRVGLAGVEVVIPQNRASAHVAEFLRANSAWLLDQVDRSERLRLVRRPRRHDVGTFPFRGEPTLVVIETTPSPPRASRVQASSGMLTISRGSTAPQSLARTLERWLREQARAAIHAHLSVVTRRLKQCPNKVLVMGQRTKWGNCSARRNLSFNWRLILAPDYVLRYLVTHEAVHLAVPDHSQRFWLTVQSLCPEAERAKQWLSANGHRLHVDLGQLVGEATPLEQRTPPPTVSEHKKRKRAVAVS